MNSIYTEAQSKKVLEVEGSAKFERVTSKYRAKISIGLDFVYYPDNFEGTFEDLRRNYFQELTAKGIDPTKFEERKMEYLNLGYQKKGTLLIYETPSKDDILKFLETKMQGVSAIFEQEVIIEDSTYKKALAEAYKNAQEKAVIMSEITGKKLGDIITVSGDNIIKSAWISHGKYDEFIYVKLVYQIQ